MGVPERHIEAPPVSEWSDEEIFARLYMAGDLSWKCLEHQRPYFDAFMQWNRLRNTKAARQRVRELEAKFDHLFMLEWGRRTGKTAMCLLIAIMFSILRPGSRGMLFTGKQKNIGGILVPLCRKLFADAPPGYEPIYRGTHGADHEGLHIDATDSYIKLVGTDLHPGATRGQFLDFAIGTEAAFVTGLEDLIQASINPQMLGRPWAFLLLESSTALEPDHDFNRVFREDAKVRGAYYCITIDANTSLTEEERAIEIQRCGGINHPTARRELFCEQVRDPEQMVVPEFDESIHVVDRVDVPTHAIAYTGMDPGSTDMCGLVFFYIDWLRQVLVVQGAWAKPNKSTSEIAEVIRASEAKYWGVSHKDPDAPRFVRQETVTLVDAMKPGHPWQTTTEQTAMLTIDGAQPTPGGKIWTAPEGALTWWDDNMHSLRPNPAGRVSDKGDPKGRGDLHDDYALDFSITEKALHSHDANLQRLRMLFTQRRIEILRNGRTEPLIQQLRSGTWNKKHTDWSRTPTLGHLDCISALMYAERDANWDKNPYPPAIKDAYLPDMHYPEPLKQKLTPLVTPQTQDRAAVFERNTYRGRR
jgi:hypothetical protein